MPGRSLEKQNALPAIEHLGNPFDGIAPAQPRLAGGIQRMVVQPLRRDHDVSAKPQHPAHVGSHPPETRVVLVRHDRPSLKIDFHPINRPSAETLKTPRHRTKPSSAANLLETKPAVYTRTRAPLFRATTSSRTRIAASSPTSPADGRAVRATPT